MEQGPYHYRTCVAALRHFQTHVDVKKKHDVTTEIVTWHRLLCKEYWIQEAA
ncbi:MAG: hypothetical protein AAGB46_12490 [Verrucomicrobiota bacterium]